MFFWKCQQYDFHVRILFQLCSASFRIEQLHSGTSYWIKSFQKGKAKIYVGCLTLCSTLLLYLLFVCKKSFFLTLTSQSKMITIDEKLFFMFLAETLFSFLHFFISTLQTPADKQYFAVKKRQPFPGDKVETCTTLRYGMGCLILRQIYCSAERKAIRKKGLSKSTFPGIQKAAHLYPCWFLSGAARIRLGFSNAQNRCEENGANETGLCVRLDLWRW